MTELPTPERIAVIWSPEAGVDRYLANHTGDVKKLKPPLTGFLSL
jgi:hypothetical protein